ncbi:MAG: hypothetical protein Q9220_007214 [cf. Caloplaca sp. 1 TL-2023]
MSEAARIKELEAQLARFQLTNQPTTLDEYLENHHNLIFSQFRVETNPRLTTRGTITKPDGRLCPNFLKPWTQFPAKRQAHFRDIHQAWNPDDGPVRALSNLVALRDIASQEQGSIRSEEDLKVYHRSVVERSVERVIKATSALDSPMGGYRDLDRGIQFHNQANVLRDGEEEVEDRRKEAAQRNKGKGVAQKKNSRYDQIPRNADQYCITSADDAARLILIEEFKAPHKLTHQFLSAILGENRKEQLDVLAIRDCLTISNDPEQSRYDDAEKLVASAATQTYAYMLPAGLAYGCIVTGEAIVFLHIAENDPHTLLYHLTIPSLEVAPVSGQALNYGLTAVAQMATFAIMAFRSRPRTQDWKDDAVKTSETWNVDYAAVERALKTPKEERRKSPIPSAFKGGRLPLLFRSHQTRSRRNDDNDGNDSDDDKPGRDRDHNSDNAHDDTSDGSPEPPSPSKSRSDRRREGDHSRGGQGSSTRDAQQVSQYCTQACLLGMVRRSVVDEKCPNVASHPRNKKVSDLHLIGPKKFRKLVHSQVAVTLDKNITDLRIHGARGMLFKITLESHGYVFVGKGTVEVFVPDIKHEGRIYQRLKSLQGTDIPVYLGNIDMERKWYDYRLCILHMLLLSYGGTPVQSLDDLMYTQVDDFRKQLQRVGIRHGDLERSNMLWNDELQRLLFIDFERSVVLRRAKPKPTTALQEISPNKLLPLKELRTLKRPQTQGCSVKKGKDLTPSTIFDEENMWLDLPIPSPDRLPSTPRSSSTKSLVRA